jgi:hypothetical protein
MIGGMQRREETPQYLLEAAGYEVTVTPVGARFFVTAKDIATGQRHHDRDDDADEAIRRIALKIGIQLKPNDDRPDEKPERQSTRK